ncbi:MAG: type I-B CRISPR-associated protein Cas7/Cst2/DevR [Catalinimonas sp.]
MTKVNSLTITYLSKVTFGSLNGGDKEVDNINPIKKITLDNGQELPYISSQALRRALRDSLIAMGEEKSAVQEASAKKGAPKTQMDPVRYIEDDLFGYMDAAPGKDGERGKSKIRTSPVRVEAMVALNEYKGDLDYATNFMAVEGGGTPNIFESEVHSGIYRGTVLIELDRVGSGQGFEVDGGLDFDEKARRIKLLLDAIQNLWSSGRQTRFLSDISPKFIAAACMTAKNPIFLEAVHLTPEGAVDVEMLASVISDYERFIHKHVFAAQQAIFPLPADASVKSLKEGFAEIAAWVEEYYRVES